MKSKKINHFNIFIYYIIVIISIILICFTVLYFVTYNFNNISSISKDWLVTVDNEYQFKTNFPHKVTWNGNRSIKAENIVPDISEGDSMFFYSSNQNMKIFIENKLIYNFQFKNKLEPFNKYINVGWHEIKMLPEYSNKKIEIFTDYERFEHSGQLFPFFITKPKIIINFIATKYGTTLILNILCLLISLLSMLTYISLSKTLINLKKLYFIMLSIILASLWVIFDNKFLQFLFPFSNLMYNLSFLCSSTFIIPTMYYLNITLVENKKEKTILNFLILINIIYLVLKILLDLFTIIAFTDARNYNYFIYFFNCLYLLFLSIKYFKNDNNKFNINLLIIPTFIVCYTINILIYVFNEDFYNGQFVLLGICIILSILLYKNISFILTNISQSYEVLRYKEISMKDTMTKTFNKSTFLTDIENIIPNKNTVILIADINNMKFINDSYSYSDGDDAIINCATILNNNFTDIGKIYRIGGDEFAIICENISENILTEKIANTNSDIFFKNDNISYSLSISLGYSYFDGKIDKNFMDTIKRADNNMYNQKKYY